VGRPNSNSLQDHAGLLEWLGDLLLLNGKYPQEQSTFEKALTLSVSTAGKWRSQIYRKISDALVQQYNHPLAHAALDQAEQALNLPTGAGMQEERQEWIQIQLARSQLFYWDNHPEQIDAIVQKISPMVAGEGRKDQQIDLLSQQYLARLRHERYRLSDETVDIARHKLELVKTLDDPYNLAWAQFQLGFGLLWHAEPQAAREWLTLCYETAKRMGARLLQVRCLAYLDIVSRKLGDLPALRSQTELLLDLAPAIGEHMYHGVGLANQGWLAWRSGDEPGGERLCQSAIELWNKYPGVYVFNGLANWVLLAIAVSHHALGGIERCAQALLDPDSLPVEEPLPRLLTEGLHFCQAGDETRALALFDQAIKKAQEFGDL